MKHRHIIIALLLLALLPTTMAAQRRGKAAKNVKVEEPEEDPRITQMRAATQKVMFIDSMVVDKLDFMSHIPLSPHIGKLTQEGGMGTFTNEMGDHRLTTTADSAIASTDFIGNRWTTPQDIAGIGTAAAANPFLMPDGITLYFAQKGEKSIGGYDIFVTRYDSEKGIFLKPENLGMPFASEADDLFYAIDEFNQLGYFVTDRRQPRGKVCIYVFIPNERRQTYATEAYSEEQMKALAGISSIADTWTSKQARNEAKERLAQAMAGKGRKTTDATGGATTELDNMRHELSVQTAALNIMRQQYASAGEEERATLRIKILGAEQQLEQLQLDIRQKEKQIPYRN